MLITDVNAILNNKITVDSEIKVRGWVKHRRDSKAGFSFITVNDGSCFDSLQLIASNQLINYTQILKLSKDCAIEAMGKLIESQGGGQKFELQLSALNIIGWVDNPETYPVSAKNHSVEHLREVAHLRIRTNLIAAVMRVKNTASMAIHEYLQQHGFFWVHTPLITTSDCEGAGELFKVSALDLKNLPLTNKGEIDYQQDFFAQETYLTVSGQLNAESYCMALSKVYTFGPTFRAENSNTTRHLAEFWMVEPELAFADLNDIAQLAEQLLKFVCKAVLEKNASEMEFFTKHVNHEVLPRIEKIIQQNFAIITYSEAIAKLENTGKQFVNPLYWGVDLASEHERYLCEEIMARPTIVTDYPQAIKAFYMRSNDDNKTVAAMDVLAPGVGEIIGGSVREERYDLLLSKIQQANLNPQTLNWYLELRKYGTAPHAGFGLGLERVVSYITGVQNLRDISSFPRTPKNASF